MHIDGRGPPEVERGPRRRGRRKVTGRCSSHHASEAARRRPGQLLDPCARIRPGSSARALLHRCPRPCPEREPVLDERSSLVYFGQLDKLLPAHRRRRRAADPAHPRSRAVPRVEKHLRLLDAPVFIWNRPKVILCHEHVGGSRAWSTADRSLRSSPSARPLVARLGRGPATTDRHGVGGIDGRASSLMWRPGLAEPVVVEEVAEIAVHGALPMLGDMATLVAYGDGGFGTMRWRTPPMRENASSLTGDVWTRLTREPAP